MMAVAVAGAGAAVVALYMGQAARVSAAKSALQETKAQNVKLRLERTKLQSVQDVYAQVDADEALVSRAYERQVLWSVYMHNLAISIPDNVWVTQFAGTVGTPATAGTTAVGSLTFAGKAFAYNDVAAWLDSVAKVKGVTDATFTAATKQKPTTTGGRALIVFNSSASLTQAAITPNKTPGSR
jgi:Tfp pilus assembly protein PilN